MYKLLEIYLLVLMQVHEGYRTPVICSQIVRQDSYKTPYRMSC